MDVGVPGWFLPDYSARSKSRVSIPSALRVIVPSSLKLDVHVASRASNVTSSAISLIRVRSTVPVPPVPEMNFVNLPSSKSKWRTVDAGFGGRPSALELFTLEGQPCDAYAASVYDADGGGQDVRRHGVQDTLEQVAHLGVGVVSAAEEDQARSICGAEGQKTREVQIGGDDDAILVPR